MIKTTPPTQKTGKKRGGDAKGPTALTTATSVVPQGGQASDTKLQSIVDPTPQEPDQSPSPPVVDTETEDARAYTAKARSTYQVVYDVYHYKKTFQQAAEELELEMDDLGTHMAIFAMQAMQALNSRGIFNQTAFLAMGLNEDGFGNVPMSDAINIARVKKGAEARARRVEEGLLVTEGIKNINIGGHTGKRTQGNVDQSARPATPRHRDNNKTRRTHTPHQQQGPSNNAQKSNVAPMPTLPPLKD